MQTYQKTTVMLRVHIRTNVTLDRIPPAIECTLSSDLPVDPPPTPYCLKLAHIT